MLKMYLKFWHRKKHSFFGTTMVWKFIYLTMILIIFYEVVENIITIWDYRKISIFFLWICFFFSFYDTANIQECKKFPSFPRSRQLVNFIFWMHAANFYSANVFWWYLNFEILSSPLGGSLAIIDFWKKALDQNGPYMSGYLLKIRYIVLAVPKVVGLLIFKTVYPEGRQHCPKKKV